MPHPQHPALGPIGVRRPSSGTPNHPQLRMTGYGGGASNVNDEGLMRYVELFAGAGGMSMGLEAAGMHPVAHAEIEPHARAVLRHHWPETPLHGDVTRVDWTQYAGQVDLVAGGSPCQDLSVAGKRAGLAGARSGLFFELIRAWEETGAPYCLWENVDGARSSNCGEDFAAVLSAFVGATVAVPSDGWRGSGVAAGRTGVAAWRVLDLQHFGPPQRRRRVFVLAARTGGCDPAEILSLTDSVCRHLAPREQQRQRAARNAAGGIANVLPSITASYANGMGHGGKDNLFVVAGEQSNAGIGIGVAPTMGTTPAGRLWAAAEPVYPTLNTTHFGKHAGCNQHVTKLAVVLPTLGRPRRLTPLECERLMGWPDRHTAQGVKEDGTAYALSDTARYRLCGNGVGAPVAAWIGQRLMAAHSA